MPVLLQAVAGGNTLFIRGTLTSTPNTTFVLEFFRNWIADQTGYGEGEVILGTASVTTNGSGFVAFSLTISASGLSIGNLVTATATGQDPDGWTSEFAENVEVEERSVWGVVWFDMDADGILDPGESGVAGVTVNLRDSTGAVVRTWLTDGSGEFPFFLLEVGYYVLEFLPPVGVGYAFSPPNQGGNDAVDSDVVDPVTGRTASFYVAPDGHVQDVFAGLYFPVIEA